MALQNAAKYGGTGAGIGAMVGGPWGAAIGGVGGALYGAFKPEDNSGADTLSELKGAAGAPRPVQPQFDPKAWDLMKQRQDLLTGQQREQSYGQQAQAAGDAWGQLAAKRGLSSGAAERVAGNASNAGMVGRQQIGMQNAVNKAGIDISGQQAKTALDQSNYSENMKGWAAAQQALAQYEARPRGLFGGDGFLGLF